MWPCGYVAKVSKFQRFRKHLVCLGRYWSCLTKSPFYLLWKLLIPCSEFSKISDRPSGFRAPSFPFVQDIFLSMFLGCIVPILQIFKLLLDGSSFSVGARLLHTFRTYRFPSSRFSNTVLFKNVVSFFLDYLRYPGVSKGTKWLVLGVWTRPKIPKSWAWGVFDFSHDEIEELLIKNEAK